ncbi:hypothetical protein A3A79_05330 [Candidatus Gottesmanbacteria bacterium RIFCSPLOWO2_01_FULL_43_11b]|uniref:Rod shape-determining protein RodA n=1 Tax=Candidatus Gottesmanbacteria bacterium RIFCSPLOWO2_01_FULL_43_11b TaxID=1798392 RepID=A0A1F6AIR1_9BACT|nr:MAG: hypothetical protein A3A79_05330 [Candidatus Gottesmanbacteria bacterium RIFCSPLOWO2_01_FULL_43_11b]
MGRTTDDWIITLLLVFLTSVGLFVLSTLSQALFLQQFVFVIFAVVFFRLFSRIDGAVLWWFAPWGYILSLILLLVSFLGPEIRGATRWIMIGTIQIQPSELVKPLLLLAFSRFMTQFSPRQFKNVLLHMLLFALPVLLVIRQPDLGTSIIYTSSWVAMMVAAGLPLWTLILAGIGVGFIFPFLWNLLAPYQRDRLTTFLAPTLDPKGAGYNALQSMIAVGSGQFFGRGLGRGTQSHLRFLPEHHTDFIFATLVEELGFFGGIALLLSYFALFVRMLMPLLRGFTDDLFAFIFSIGLFAVIMAQVFIHVGMNMGVLPITGITLPLVSYGGSSVISIAISFGIWFALVRRR